jgi:hypothetical protein
VSPGGGSGGGGEVVVVEVGRRSLWREAEGGGGEGCEGGSALQLRRKGAGDEGKDVVSPRCHYGPERI